MMLWIRITLLLTAMVMTSGYRFRCYFACVDQTSVQNDYVEQRDRCREYAQLKVDMAMRESGGNMEDSNRKTQLVSLFSYCMGRNGWSVPDGKGEGGRKAEAPPPPAAITSQAAVAAPPTAAMVATNKAEERAQISRNAECAFARHSASVSSIAAKRAQACDLECENALKMSPGAPRPPSCAPVSPDKFSKGHEE